MIDASHLLILTSQEQVVTKDGNNVLGKISKEEAIQLIDGDNFEPLTSLPKIEAGVSFVSSGDGRTAIITKLEYADQGMKERVGTIIR